MSQNILKKNYFFDDVEMSAIPVDLWKDIVLLE